MKKSFILLGLAVAAMTSCTNEEVLSELQENQKAISFDTFVNKATRAVSAAGSTTNDIAKFYAYAYYEKSNATTTVFSGDPVTKDGSAWGYTGGDKYWTKNVYEFAAYANGNSADAVANVRFEDETLTIPSYTVGTADLVADVIEKDNKTDIVSGENVQFTFEHLLTKLQFKVVNTDSKYDMRITDLVINGAKNVGTCNVTASGATWTPSGTATTYIPIDNNTTGDYITKVDNDTDKDQVVSAEFFVMPQGLANVTFSIVADFYDEDDQIVGTKTFNAVSIVNKDENKQDVEEWEPGTFYVYTLQLPIAAKPIIFGQPTVNGVWKTGGTIELNPGDGGSNGTTN